MSFRGFVDSVGLSNTGSNGLVDDAAWTTSIDTRTSMAFWTSKKWACVSVWVCVVVYVYLEGRMVLWRTEKQLREKEKLLMELERNAKLGLGITQRKLEAKLMALLATKPELKNTKLLQELQGVVRQDKQGFFGEPSFSQAMASNAKQEVRELLYQQLSKNMKEEQKKALKTGPMHRIRSPPYVWDLFEPLWSCDTDYRVGGAGDGAKWVCDIHTLSPPCRVYSFGLSDFIPFEQDILNLTHCELFGFDPTPGLDLDSHRQLHLPGASFYPYGLSGRDGDISQRKDPYSMDMEWLEMTLGPNMFTLRSLMGKMGHRAVDMLKMDIEGGEWGVLNNIFTNCANIPEGLRWLLVEVHLWHTELEEVISVFSKIEACGFRLYHKEPNLYSSEITYSAPCCVEYAWIRMA